MSQTDLKLGDIIELEIDKLSFGEGDGVARFDNLVVFFPLTAPGDLVQAEVTFKKKTFAKAKVLKQLRPSPKRSEAPCPVYGTCGGCQWQHLSYEEQLNSKENILKETFQRAGLSVSSWHGIVGSPRQFRYRNRIQVHFKDGQFGFRARKSNQTIATQDCLIAESPLIEFAKQKAQELEGRHEIFLSEDNEVEFRDTNTESEGHFFSQVNSSVNELLGDLVVQSVPADSQMVWDLYGGSGNFSIALSKKLPAAEITCVDANANNILAGKSKAKQMGLARLNFRAETTNSFLKDRTSGQVCIVDPPRSGLDSITLNQLINSKLSKIIYISCDPMTLIRDLRAFQNESWSVDEIRPLDMFPQTFHLETLAVLSKTSDA
jgi:tRNA/tmRNA/rRNA uracil-C5-methylase (TrmA/RlmC/RlmD family)